MAQILVIEDDDSIRQLISLVLTDAGHTIVEAVNGREGLVAAESMAPNLVITDLVMPEKEGIETIIELRRKYPDLRIIAMSGGNRASNYLDLASKLGAMRTLAKPFKLDALLQAVSDVVAQSENR